MVKEKEKNLVIFNTRASLVHLPAITSTDPRVAEGIGLLPGENDVPEWYWQKCKRVAAVRIWIAAGHLEDRGEGVAKPLFLGLDALSEQAALAQIDKCEEVRLLKDWAAATTNATLQRACKMKIDSLIKAVDSE